MPQSNNNNNKQQESDFLKFIKENSSSDSDSKDGDNKDKDGDGSKIYEAFKLFTIGMFLLGPFAMIGILALGLLTFIGKKIYDKVTNKPKTPNDMTKDAAKAYEEKAPESELKKGIVDQILGLSKDENGKELSPEKFQARLSNVAVLFSNDEKGKKILADPKIQQLFKTVFNKDINEVVKEAKENVKNQEKNKEDNKKEEKIEDINKNDPNLQNPDDPNNKKEEEKIQNPDNPNNKKEEEKIQNINETNPNLQNPDDPNKKKDEPNKIKEEATKGDSDKEINSVGKDEHQQKKVVSEEDRKKVQDQKEKLQKDVLRAHDTFNNIQESIGAKNKAHSKDILDKKEKYDNKLKGLPKEKQQEEFLKMFKKESNILFRENIENLGVLKDNKDNDKEVNIVNNTKNYDEYNKQLFDIYRSNNPNLEGMEYPKFGGVDSKDINNYVKNSFDGLEKVEKNPEEQKQIDAFMKENTEQEAPKVETNVQKEAPQTDAPKTDAPQVGGEGSGIASGITEAVKGVANTVKETVKETAKATKEATNPNNASGSQDGKKDGSSDKKDDKEKEKDKGITADQLYNMFKLFTIGMFLLGPALMIGILAAGLLAVGGKMIYDRFKGEPSKEGELSPQEQVEAASKGVKDADLEEEKTMSLVDSLLDLAKGNDGKQLDPKEFGEKLVSTVAGLGETSFGKSVLKNKQVNQLFTKAFGADLSETVKHAQNTKAINDKLKESQNKLNERENKLKGKEKEHLIKGFEFFKDQFAKNHPDLKEAESKQYAQETIDKIQANSSEKEIKAMDAKSPEEFKKYLTEIAGNHKAFKQMTGIGKHGKDLFNSLTDKSMINAAKGYYKTDKLTSEQIKDLKDIYDNAKISDSSYLKENMSKDQYKAFKKEEDKIQKEKDSIKKDTEKLHQKTEEQLEKEDIRHQTEQQKQKEKAEKEKAKEEEKRKKEEEKRQKEEAKKKEKEEKQKAKDEAKKQKEEAKRLKEETKKKEKEAKQKAKEEAKRKKEENNKDINKDNTKSTEIELQTFNSEENELENEEKNKENVNENKELESENKEKENLNEVKLEDSSKRKEDLKKENSENVININQVYDINAPIETQEIESNVEILNINNNDLSENLIDPNSSSINNVEEPTKGKENNMSRNGITTKPVEFKVNEFSEFDPTASANEVKNELTNEKELQQSHELGGMFSNDIQAFDGIMNGRK